jgi:hypothetical protein
VRVLDGEHAGQTGYVLAARLKFLGQSSSKQAGAVGTDGGQVGDSRGSDWQASCHEDGPFPSDPTGELSWSFLSRKTKAEAQKDADFHNALRGHHAGVERGIDWGSLKVVPEPEGKEAGGATRDWLWTALCTQDHRKPPLPEPGSLIWSSRPRRKTKPEAQEDADRHNRATGHHAEVFGMPR